jgi:hypothetical protein
MLKRIFSGEKIQFVDDDYLSASEHEWLKWLWNHGYLGASNGIYTLSIKGNFYIVADMLNSSYDWKRDFNILLDLLNDSDMSNVAVIISRLVAILSEASE